MFKFIFVFGIMSSKSSARLEKFRISLTKAIVSKECYLSLIIKT